VELNHEPGKGGKDPGGDSDWGRWVPEAWEMQNRPPPPDQQLRLETPVWVTAPAEPPESAAADGRGRQRPSYDRESSGEDSVADTRRDPGATAPNGHRRRTATESEGSESGAGRDSGVRDEGAWRVGRCGGARRVDGCDRGERGDRPKGAGERDPCAGARCVRSNRGRRPGATRAESIAGARGACPGWQSTRACARRVA